MKTTFFPASRLTLSLLAAGLLAAAPLAWSGHHHEDDGHDDHGHDEHNALNHDEHHDENRQLGAHVHGAAQLLVARDHDHVTVLLSSPSINLVGFEHYAQSDADRETLQTAEELLSNPANVFALTAAAQCALESVHIQSEQLAEMQSDEPHDEHEGHGQHASGHDEHGHADSHGPNDHEHGHQDHHENRGHGHGHNNGSGDHEHDDHGHDHADGSVHSEFTVEYEFHCASPNRLTGLQVNVFDAFRGFETVDVQWILDGEQGAQRSRTRRTRVTF